MNTQIGLSRSQLLRLLDGYPVQVPTKVGMLDLTATAEPAWQPLVKGVIPRHIRTHHHGIGQPAPDELWRNATYEVFVYKTRGEEGTMIHLSIKRYDRAAIRNWRHLQQMKNEIVGPEVEALELFPRESRLADNANQYHLWCLPEGMDIPVGWEGGMVLIRDDEVDAFNAADHGGRQEPRQDGLTVGDTLDGARTPELDRQVRSYLGVTQ